MPDILEYQPIIDTHEIGFFIKGVCDEDPLTTPNPNPPYWLYVKVNPLPNFAGETELYVEKITIEKSINELELLRRDLKGTCEIKCVGWGSYLSFTIGKKRDLIVSGQINKRWDAENNHLKFSFTTNINVIPKTCKVLEELLNNDPPSQTKQKWGMFKTHLRRS
jgi:hypothetical protein